MRSCLYRGLHRHKTLLMDGKITPLMKTVRAFVFHLRTDKSGDYTIVEKKNAHILHFSKNDNFQVRPPTAFTLICTAFEVRYASRISFRQSFCVTSQIPSKLPETWASLQYYPINIPSYIVNQFGRISHADLLCDAPKPTKHTDKDVGVYIIIHILYHTLPKCYSLTSNDLHHIHNYNLLVPISIYNF